MDKTHLQLLCYRDHFSDHLIISGQCKENTIVYQYFAYHMSKEIVYIGVYYDEISGIQHILS